MIVIFRENWFGDEIARREVSLPMSIHSGIFEANGEVIAEFHEGLGWKPSGETKVGEHLGEYCNMEFVEE
jgi:hypothetical protein